MLILALVVAVLVSFAATPVVARVAARRGLLDDPRDARRVHTVAVPRLGGVAVFVAALVGLAIAVVYRGAPLGERQVQFLGCLLCGGGLMFVTGLIDDVRPMRARVKLLCQIAAASIVYAFGLRVDFLTLAGTAGIPVGTLALPLTILWIVGVTNAFNLIDGLDGLASGIAVIALGTVAATALVLGKADVALVCAALLGAVLGFLPYNLHPARIFLGDSGSLFIGFMLAVLSVYGSFKSTTALVVAVPLLALAVPLLDMLVAVARRWLRGQPVLSADRRHIHHRLLAIGFTPSRATLALCALTATFALLGLAMAFAPPPALRGITYAGGAGSLLLLAYGARRLHYHEFIEATVALASGAKRARRVVRDQITAREIANLLSHAETVVHVNAILEDRADELGFLSLQVVHPFAHDVRVAGTRSARLWKMEYPVTPEGTPEERLCVLRICCDLRYGPRPYGAERVSRVIAPVIQDWLARQGDAVVLARGAAAAASVEAPAPVAALRETPREALPVPTLAPKARRLAGAHD